MTKAESPVTMDSTKTGNVTGIDSSQILRQFRCGGNGEKKMTIKDIAKACGVSVSTVSRVLNDHPDVSRDVRERVRSTVERLGYIPNNSARDLVRTQSDNIGVVVRGRDNLFFSDMVNTISREIERRGYTMVLHFIGSDDDEVMAGAILEREKKLRGIIFLGGRFDYSSDTLSPVGVPFVCCTYTNCFGSLDEKDYSSVSIDDYETAFQAVKTLIKLGHRRIAVVAPATHDRSISELRYKGYRAALEQNGLEFDPRLLAETEGCFEMPKAYEGTAKLIESGAEFTAVFALSDTNAMAVMKALEDRGRRVPEDCSVIGIDGLTVSEYSNPTLTTMVQPVEEMGRQSVSILAGMIEQKQPCCHLRLEARLRPGGSVRKI